MIYNLSNKADVNDFKLYSDKLLANNSKVDLKQVRVTRSALQNRSLHKYFTIISDELNELGMCFNYFGVKGQALEMRYTPHIVKEFFWRPIQIALFDIESTTKINTKQINGVIDVVTKFFGDRGVVLHFPSVESLEVR